MQLRTLLGVFCLFVRFLVVTLLGDVHIVYREAWRPFAETKNFFYSQETEKKLKLLLFLLLSLLSSPPSSPALPPSPPFFPSCLPSQEESSWTTFILTLMHHKTTEWKKAKGLSIPMTDDGVPVFRAEDFPVLWPMWNKSSCKIHRPESRERIKLLSPAPSLYR